MDPLSGELSLPGWDSSYKKEDLQNLFNEYKKVDEEKLWENLEYFLKAIIPVAEECDVKMAIHPDDPPYPIFGLPRIITSEKNLDRFLKLVDSKYNGLTLCTGSLGCAKSNDVTAMVDKYSKMGRIHFMHAVSYTHLDVYKRQIIYAPFITGGVPVRHYLENRSSCPHKSIQYSLHCRVPPTRGSLESEGLYLLFLIIGFHCYEIVPIICAIFLFVNRRRELFCYRQRK